MRLLAALDLRPLVFALAAPVVVGVVLWADGQPGTDALRAAAAGCAVVATTGVIWSTARTWARCKLEAASSDEPDAQSGSS